MRDSVVALLDSDDIHPGHGSSRRFVFSDHKEGKAAFFRNVILPALVVFILSYSSQPWYLKLSIAILYVYFHFRLPKPKPNTLSFPHNVVFGHRCAPTSSDEVIVENTLQALYKAHSVPGFSGVEIDLQQTRDGHLVVFHDVMSLDRLCEIPSDVIHRRGSSVFDRFRWRRRRRRRRKRTEEDCEAESGESDSDSDYSSDSESEGDDLTVIEDHSDTEEEITRRRRIQRLRVGRLTLAELKQCRFRGFEDEGLTVPTLEEFVESFLSLSPSPCTQRRTSTFDPTSLSDISDAEDQYDQEFEDPDQSGVGVGGLVSQGNEFFCMMEIKAFGPCTRREARFVRKLVRVFKKYPELYSRAFVASFNPCILYQIRTRDENIQSCLISHQSLFGELWLKTKPRLYKKRWLRCLISVLDYVYYLLTANLYLLSFLGVKFVAMGPDMPEKRLKVYQAKGISPICWGVNDRNEMKRLERLNVSFVTDDTEISSDGEEEDGGDQSGGGGGFIQMEFE